METPIWEIHLGGQTAGLGRTSRGERAPYQLNSVDKKKKKEREVRQFLRITLC